MTTVLLFLQRSGVDVSGGHRISREELHLSLDYLSSNKAEDQQFACNEVRIASLPATTNRSFFFSPLPGDPDAILQFRY